MLKGPTSTRTLMVCNVNWMFRRL